MISGNRESGFTLLEIVVVMVIVATLASLAALSLGGLSRHDVLEQAAQRIVLAVDLGAEEAALSGYPIGLELYNTGYNYQVYRDGEWQLLQRGKLFEPYEFASNIDISFNIDGNGFDILSSANEVDLQPTLILLPDGERWLRTIALFDSNSDNVLTLAPSAGSYRIEPNSP